MVKCHAENIYSPLTALRGGGWEMAAEGKPVVPPLQHSLQPESLPCLPRAAWWVAGSALQWGDSRAGTAVRPYCSSDKHFGVPLGTYLVLHLCISGPVSLLRSHTWPSSRMCHLSLPPGSGALGSCGQPAHSRSGTGALDDCWRKVRQQLSCSPATRSTL